MSRDRKESSRRYYEKNRLRILARGKEYAKKNREKLLLYWREYYKENREKDKAWRLKNKDRLRALDKKKKDANREKYRAQNREWYKNNPEWAVAKEARRRAAKKSSEKHFSKEDVKRIYDEQNGQCVCCGEPLSGGYHVDHIIPLSKGGSNGPDNIQLLLPVCNVQKKDRDNDEFMRSREV